MARGCAGGEGTGNILTTTQPDSASCWEVAAVGWGKVVSGERASFPLPPDSTRALFRTYLKFDLDESGFQRHTLPSTLIQSKYLTMRISEKSNIGLSCLSENTILFFGGLLEGRKARVSANAEE